MSEKEIKTIFLRSIYEAAIEILGTSESVLIFSTIINWDGTGEPPDIKNKPEFLSDLGNEFAIRFQRNTAKGLLLRIGDSSFTFQRRNLKELVQLGSIENRLKPISKRFDHSLGILADNLSALSGLEIRAIKKNQNSFCLEITRNVEDDLFSSDLHFCFPVIYIYIILLVCCARFAYGWTAEKNILLMSMKKTKWVMAGN